jgi:hypothetical protein
MKFRAPLELVTAGANQSKAKASRPHVDFAPGRNVQADK